MQAAGWRIIDEATALLCADAVGAMKSACDATLERLDIPAGTRADGTVIVDSTGGGI